MDSSNRKNVIQDIISKIIIYDKGEVRVEGNLPLFHHELGYEFISRDSRLTKCGEIHFI